MPNQSIYQQQAEFNEKTAIAAQSGFPDWAVIMCFYAALHWVNDYAFREGNIKEFDTNDDYSPHKLRRMYVKKIAKLNRWNDLEEAYELLYRASMTARYLRGLENQNCTAREYYAKNGVQFCFDDLEKIKKRLS
ncbi:MULTISPECIES: hypothetical protein [Nostoc]|jgi:hypothetical protein|uniref:hypothetical protein n=1 Tax=Nostoc TaxID=1177 RepID=UPI0018C74AB3|nr:hypothetical protein [Nostoc commune]MBG1257737.1 hypothetical protein [Nostoc commune BAE]